MKLIKVLYLRSLWVVAFLLVLSTCDAIDVMDPNFNDRNIGIWEKWTDDNNYTYIEISENEVVFESSETAKIFLQSKDYSEHPKKLVNVML